MGFGVGDAGSFVGLYGEGVVTTINTNTLTTTTLVVITALVTTTLPYTLPRTTGAGNAVVAPAT